MSSYGNFLSWFYTNQKNINTQHRCEPSAIQCPGPARNAPPNIQIKSLTSMIVIHKADLDQTRLRHILTTPPKNKFPPRHPVLQEIMNKAYQKSMRRQICLAVLEYFENVQ